jgi:hypothetical protein
VLWTTHSQTEPREKNKNKSFLIPAVLTARSQKNQSMHKQCCPGVELQQPAMVEVQRLNSSKLPLALTCVFVDQKLTIALAFLIRGGSYAAPSRFASSLDICG